MLLGLVKPTDGQALVLGAPSGSVDIRRKIGFLPEDFRFYTWLTAGELLKLHGRLCGLSASRLAERVPILLELVGLAPHREKRLREFSKGMLQRIGLAQALIHEPELIFLDEPTSGLDPMGRRLVRDVIRAQRQRGATVFLNSHLLSEVEITCDRVAFIKQGEIVGSHDLRTQSDGEIRVVAFVQNLPAETVVGLSRWCTSIKRQEDLLTFSANSKEVLPEVHRYLAASGADIFSFTPERLPLEELFLKIMGEDGGL